MVSVTGLNCGDDLGDAVSAHGHSAGPSDPSQSSLSRPKAAAVIAAEIDSSVYKMTFFGILNADGEFWTPLAFDSSAAAREHIIRFWNLRAEPGYPDKAAAFLRTAKIVPVRIHLTALPPLAGDGA